MIYGRSKQPVSILRLASSLDFKMIEGVRPKEEDYQAMDNRNYLVIDDSGTLRIYRRHWLKADGGDKEIEAAVVSVMPPSSKPVVLASDEFDVET